MGSYSLMTIGFIWDDKRSFANILKIVKHCFVIYSLPQFLKICENH